MNKKTTRLSSIALALMMVLMVALTLVPVSAALADTNVIMEIPDGTSSSAKDSNNVIIAPDKSNTNYTNFDVDSSIKFTLKVTDYDYTGDESSYDGLYMELIDPSDKVVNGYAVSNRRAMTKVNSTTYTYPMEIKWEDTAFYSKNAVSGDYTDPITGLYKIKVYPYKGNQHLTVGTHELGAFYFALLDEDITGEITTTVDPDDKYYAAASDKHYAGPEAKIDVELDLTTSFGPTATTDGEIRYNNPFTGERVKTVKFSGITAPSGATDNLATYQVPKNATHGNKYNITALVLQGDNAEDYCKAVPCEEASGNLTANTYTITIDAKGPEVGEVYLSNTVLIGKLWKNGYMLESSGTTPGNDENYIEVKSLEDKDSGIDTTAPGYVLFKNRYHESLNYGEDGVTDLIYAAAPTPGTYGDKQGFTETYELELNTSGHYTSLLDKEYDVIIDAIDYVGNKAEKNIGNVKFYEPYVQIGALRVEAQNVLEMYVGQTLTKDDIAMRNVKVWTDGVAGDDASFPDNWYWYVKLASANLLDFDPVNMTITAKKAGEGQIYATPFINYDDGTNTESFSPVPEDYIKVVITDQPTVKSISLNNTTATIKAGATQQLTATVDPAGVAVTWESSDKAIATVDANGLVTGVADGKAVIFAKAGAQVATCSVTVQGDVVATGISLNKTANTMVVGTSETLFATTTPAGAPVTWNTSNAAVATVDNAGKVTAMTAGTATITATSGSYSATCVVTVEGIAETLEPNQWYTDDMGNIYYSNEHAQLTVGWKKIGGYWYLFDYSTAVMKKGWAKDAGTWYYLQSDGKMKTGWLKDGSTWYYLQASGAMKTGWLKDGGVWYYLKDSGAMATGWVKVSGIWYYLQGSGAMKEGWLLESGVWYYLTPSSGAMLANGTYTVEGRKSQFAASGRWLGYV